MIVKDHMKYESDRYKHLEELKVKIKDMELEYEEYYGICDNCKSELFVPGVTDQNEERIEELYRKRKNLITISEIKKILNKYNIEKRKLYRNITPGQEKKIKL